MPDYSWPPQDTRRLMGKNISRIDGVQKASGRAKYASDTNKPGLLFGALLTGTSSRNFGLSIDPTLVQYLTFMIEGIIILLVSTDLITLRLLKGGRRIRVALRRRPSVEAEESAS